MQDETRVPRSIVIGGVILAMTALAAMIAVLASGTPGFMWKFVSTAYAIAALLAGLLWWRLGRIIRRLDELVAKMQSVRSQRQTRPRAG